MKSTEREDQFGGNSRAFLPDYIFNNIPETDKDRLSDDAREALDIIKEGFETLSPLEQQVMGVLVSESDVSYEKIAEIVGSTVNGVDTAIRRAKKKLLDFARENAGSSPYIEGMLRGLEDEE